MNDDELKQLAIQARRQYQKEWRRKNRDRIRDRDNQYHKQWCSENPDKVKKYNETYWQRKALELAVTNKPNDVEQVSKIVTDIVTNKVTDHVTDHVTDRPAVTDNVCIICGKVFLSKRIDTLYCSPSCKQKNYRQSKQLRKV